MEKIRNFRDLKIWQVGIEIVEDVYRLTKLFPRNEEFGLVTQMQRSSVSIPSNIAEGFGR
ncbi:MAG: four helix bundle protein, partial [Candidatus Omnitrophica bacterium]|nr:four helix bundle protein [Candidatus Omnitrophota bacterium]